jgi:hypothetical protein
MVHKRVDPFERDVLAFLREFPEFTDECPIVKVPGYPTPQRIMTAKGVFGFTVWARAHEAGKPSVRDAILHGFLEENPGADVLYQAMYRRMTRQAQGSIADQLSGLGKNFPSIIQWKPGKVLEAEDA